MEILGYIALYIFLISISASGLLNLAECGDRIGPKYRLSNWLQVLIPIGILIGIQVFK